jgi:hypothetical protein
MKINNLQIEILSCLITAILFSSCGNGGKPESSTGSNENSLSIKVEVPTVDDAIQKVKTHASQIQQTVMVPTTYFESVQKKKACDQIDRDLGRCSGADSFSEYGYKMVTQNERRCCRPEAKLVSKITGNWVATYLEPKNEWEVALEYKDDSKEDQKVSWSISLSPSNGVQVEFGG